MQPLEPGHTRPDRDPTGGMSESTGTLTPSPDPWADPEPGLIAPDGRHYPLESAEIEADAEGGIARTLLRQRFQNPFEEPLEVLYTLPLPADGAVLGYEIRIGERRIVGEVQPRAKAEATYRQALYEGRTAGLLEEDRADTFNQRLGNIPAKTPVEVEIRILHPLAFRGAGDSEREAGWEYRFPTTLGVRYMGAEGRVPDAERLEPGRSMEGLPARFTLELRVADMAWEEDPSSDEELQSALWPTADSDPIPTGIHSRSHMIHAERNADGSHRIRLAEPSRLDRDLVVRWPALESDVRVQMVEGGGLEGDGGRYALLTVLPPERPRVAFPRDVTLLLDASGSMRGTPLALAKRVIDGVLAGLEEGNHFELLAFSNRVRSLTSGLVAATGPVVEEARRELDGVRASGGTEMATAFLEALAPRRAEAQRQVVLITDGYVGFEDEVTGLLSRDAEGAGRVRVHTVGVGSAPNRTLTAGLARAGGGCELFATDDGEADEAVDLLRAATDRPVLCGLSVSGSAVRRVAPEGSRDVSAGQPALLSVELRPEGGTLEVTAREADSDVPWQWRGAVPGPERTTEPSPEVEGRDARRSPLPLGALHGRERIADLELHARGRGARALADQIEAVALRHRIVSRRTSLVAVAEEATEDPRAPRRRVRLPVELPAGLSARGVGMHAQVLATPSSPPVGLRESRSDAYSAMLEEPLFDALGLEGSDSEMGHDVAPGDRRSERAGWDVRKKPRGRPPLPPAIPVEVMHRSDELLVVEFELPVDGVRLPTGRVTLRLPDGSTLRARVDRKSSTEPGPHRAGVRVRLALERLEGAAWPPREARLVILTDGWR